MITAEIESNSVSICPKCHSAKDIIKYGKRNEIQRYRCKNCKYVFPERRKRIKYSANDETMLALLVSLMNAEKGNLVNTAIKNIAKVLNDIDNYHLEEKQSTNDKLIFCRNPRLLLCDNEDGNIIIYRISENRESKEIKIIDESLIMS